MRQEHDRRLGLREAALAQQRDLVEVEGGDEHRGERCRKRQDPERPRADRFAAFDAPLLNVVGVVGGWFSVGELADRRGAVDDPEPGTGTTTSAMVPAATSQAWRQPTSSITNDNATGTSAISADESVMVIPRAKPRRRSNHREIVTEETSDRDP